MSAYGHMSESGGRGGAESADQVHSNHTTRLLLSISPALNWTARQVVVVVVVMVLARLVYMFT